MFEDDEDDSSVTMRANEKSKSIYNRLNTMLDDKKNTPIQVVNTNIGVEEKTVNNLFGKKTGKKLFDDEAPVLSESEKKVINIIPEVVAPILKIQEQPKQVVESKPVEIKRKPLFTDNGEDEIKKVVIVESKPVPNKPKEMIKTTSMPVFGSDGKSKTNPPQNLRQSESVWSEVSGRESKDDDYVDPKQRMLLMQNMLKNKIPNKVEHDKQQLQSVRESIDREDTTDHFIDNIMNQKEVVSKKKPKRKMFEGESIEVNFRPSNSSEQTVIRETIFEAKLSRLEEIPEVPEERKDDTAPQRKKNLFVDDDEAPILTKKESKKQVKKFNFDD